MVTRISGSMKLSAGFQDVYPMLNSFQGLAMPHINAVNTFKVTGRGMRNSNDTKSCNTAIMHSHFGITVRVQTVELPYMERKCMLSQFLLPLILTLKMAMGIYI